MADFKERRFSIDPGKGKKMDGCPYSIFEDGRDVKDYIIPPKGYVFKGFKFGPDACTQIYVGKLIAIYEKEPFNDILKSNLWKFMLALFIIAVITVIAILVVNVFKGPKTPKTPEPKKASVTVVDTIKAKETSEPATVIDTTPLPTDSVKQEEAVVIELSSKNEKVEETPQPAADDPNVQFKQAFWTLIHQRTIMMDPYDALFKEYKNKVEGEEYDYLRFTILKDYSTFKVWYGKLHKVPVSELETINTINDLKNKLDSIE